MVKNKIISGASKLVMAALLIISCNQEKNALIFEEVDGIVAVEAEHYYEQTLDEVRKWYIIKDGEEANILPDPDPGHASAASGKAYIELLPDTRVTHDDELVNDENFSYEAGKMAIISYQVYFNTPGKYYVWARAFSTGTEDNGVHVGINDTWPESGKRMQWIEKNKWAWESKQRTEQNHLGEPELLYLEVPEKGLHKISFSMREDGFELDKWIMSLKYEKPEGEGIPERIFTK